jgi:hypothetical protein
MYNNAPTWSLKKLNFEIDAATNSQLINYLKKLKKNIMNNAQRLEESKKKKNEVKYKVMRKMKKLASRTKVEQRNLEKHEQFLKNQQQRNAETQKLKQVGQQNAQRRINNRAKQLEEERKKWQREAPRSLSNQKKFLRYQLDRAGRAYSETGKMKKTKTQKVKNGLARVIAPEGLIPNTSMYRMLGTYSSKINKNY